MDKGVELISFKSYSFHKGFYILDDEPEKCLLDIRYDDFYDEPDDDVFPYDTAYTLLNGSCNIFALSLEKKLGYCPYIIEEKNDKGFHAFCQVYKNKKWHYIDARGVTTSFNEFMEIAKTFVRGEYIIRPIDSNDIKGWNENRNDDDYDKEAYMFAEAIIEKYKEYYTV